MARLLMAVVGGILFGAYLLDVYHTYTRNETRKAYCDICRQNIMYNTIESARKREINGEVVSYNEIKSICQECGNEVFVPNIRDENIERLYQAYRG